jgi:outer membrane protein TolC
MRSKICIIWIFLFFIIFLKENFFCETPLVLTLEKSIEIALNKSYSIKTLNESVKKSTETLIAARAALRSYANLSFDVPSYSESINQVLDAFSNKDVFEKKGSFQTQGQVIISQPFSTNGTLSLVGTFFRNNLFNDSKRFNPLTNTEFGRTDSRFFSNKLYFRFIQPIFTPNTLKMNIRRAELGFEETDKQYKRYQLAIVADVTNGFYNLYRAKEQVKINESLVKQSEEAYQMAKNRFQADLIPEVEVMQLEVELARNRNSLEISMGDLKRIEDSFKHYIGLDINQEIETSTELVYEPITIDINDALSKSLKYRTEINVDEINIERSGMSVVEAHTRNEFKGNIVATYGVDGTDERYRNTFRDFDLTRSVTVNFSVPIWDWGRNRAEVQAAEADLKNAENRIEDTKVKIQEEVRDAVRKLEESKSRIGITEKNIELANKTYDISLERFKNGDITSRELALEQNSLTNAKVEYLNALIDYKKALMDIMVKTMWDYANNKPAVSDL